MGHSQKYKTTAPMATFRISVFATSSASCADKYQRGWRYYQAPCAPSRTFNSALLACGGAEKTLAYLGSDENGADVTDHLQTS